MRKIPNFPVLKGVIFLICPWNIRTLPLHFSDDQLSPLIRKIGKKIKRNCTFGSILHCSFHFSLSLPKVLGHVRHFVITPLSDLVLTCISQNFVCIAYANQKLFRRNLWGGRLDPPPPLWYPKG